MKHSQFILGLIIVTLIGCTNLIDENQPDSLVEPMVFMADVEVPEDNFVSKTLLGGDVSDAYRTILWEQGDEVYVSNGDNSSKFVSVTREKSSSTQLEGELSSGSLYYAAYPYDLVDSFKSSTFNIKLPSVQTYSKEGVSPGAFPMVAYSVDRDLKFKNICGLFVLQLTGKHSIASISFSGKDQNANKVTVAGIASVSMDYSDVPSIDLTNSSETDITLICDDPVQLLPGEATSFHFVLPESTFSSFSLLITAEDGSTMIVNSEKTLSIKRSTRTTASPLEYIPYSIDISNSVDLSANDQTANCYIVSESGVYKFAAVKGNCNSSDYNGLLWDVESVDVLWESFGTDITPRKGDLIRALSYDGNNIHFATNELFQEGNALIAARDKDGDILWSWHVWFTDKPIDQIYPSGAGSMMDRNLGATDNAVGEVGSLGLMYQWGRKDPFLGSSSIAESVKAKSTITWPESTSLNLSTGVMEYSIGHPTTFIQGNYDFNDDWCDSYDGEVRWTTTDHEKSIYDPCPAGYRVPDGEIWSNARLVNLSYNNEFKGLNLFENVWYPAAGNLYNGTVTSSGIGRYWTASYSNDSRYPHYISHLYIREIGGILFDAVTYKSLGASVRCFKEYSDVNLPVVSDAEDLNDDGESANSYVVSKVGTYKFDAVKGNSDESVGEAVSAEILWKSFGTDVVPNYKDLVLSVSYSEGEVYFTTSEQFQEGNVLLAVKDANDVILWSWHIWLTDQPGECTYANNAGVLMDRNLGAISNTRGSIGAIGLQYQWGRKDPFLGPCTLYDNTMAASTGDWKSVHVNSTISVEWATKNPMTYITTTDSDWNGNFDPLWDTEKTVYDPCPSGWQVPEGGKDGVWSTSGVGVCEYDKINKGITIPEPYSVPAAWYPRTLERNGISASLGNGEGAYWALNAASFDFNSSNYFNVNSYDNRTVSKAVRCMRENSSTPPSESVDEYIDLSIDATANCYIVSTSGKYKFNATVKGNSTESVGSVETAEVLWESFGTDVTPSVGDIVCNILYNEGYIEFETPSQLAEGNAVIAAKDASGTILWSWHIWVTDRPEEHIYYNNAGTVMDRNLGATSVTPGDVGALGLLYQWGRKDPFLATSSIENFAEVASTGAWSQASTSSSVGTVVHTIQNPTQFIVNPTAECGDWHYANRNNELWSVSKTIYDPCPKGWRVPENVWATLKGVQSFHSFLISGDINNKGFNFSNDFGNDSIIWYPSVMWREYSDGGNHDGGSYWTSITNDTYAFNMLISFIPESYHINGTWQRAAGKSIRCQKE